MESSLPRYATNTSANDAWKLLVAHGQQHTDTPTDQRGHEDREAGEKPKGHDDVLLLAGGTTPLCCLLRSILVGDDSGGARTRVA